MSARIRVLVVDDSALMRKLIPRLLENDPSIEVVGTAMDGAIALKKIEDLRPDVLTLDLEMPGLNGIDATRCILSQLPMTRILVLSGCGTAEHQPNGVAATGRRPQ